MHGKRPLALPFRLKHAFPEHFIQGNEELLLDNARWRLTQFKTGKKELSA